MTYTSRHKSKYALLLGSALPLLGALGLSGCKNTLSDAAAPQGALSQTTLSNQAGVEATLIGAYRAMDWNGAVGGNTGTYTPSNWLWGSTTSDDAYKGSQAGDYGAVTDVDLYQWSTANTDGLLNDKWRGVYEGVSRANSTLSLLKTVRAQAGAISDADAKAIAGEAIFLRAYYHFEAYRVWGNIPYYYETDTDFRKPNIKAADVITALEKDLDSAAVLLPATPRNGAKGRATSWTAKAYKGRVQVYAGQWGDALTTLRNVQATGPYALETSYDHVWTGFNELQNGPETILAYQAAVNDGEPDGDNANYGERLNFPHSGSPFGCCGFHQPSQNLVNFFAVDPVTGLPAALTNPNWNANNSNFVAGSTTPVDPRLDWTVGRDGVPYKDWGPHAPTWIRAPGYSGFYSPRKNVHEKSSGAQSNVGWTPTQLNSVKIHAYRYGDLLLNLAEAEVEAGSLENARTIVNQIRTRAGQKAQGPGVDKASIAVPINDPSITWATYKVGLYTTPFASQDEARTAVRYERRLELAMEGQRFYDLRRYGTYQQVLNAYVATEQTRRPWMASAQQVTARHLY
ncbi:MAG TPA: RagB/SusD family nutrient uptake outer membrane protein, partial [Gemmatirosa sp.]